MVHLTHSSIHWRLRCIDDSSSDENTPPNVLQPAPEQGCPSGADVASSATGTATPPWLSPEKTKHRSKSVTNAPPGPTPATTPRPAACACTSPTTSSPVLLETPPRSPARTKTSKPRHPRQGQQERRQAAAPYARQRSTPPNAHRPAGADQDRHVRGTAAAQSRHHAAATDQGLRVRHASAVAQGGKERHVAAVAQSGEERHAAAADQGLSDRHGAAAADQGRQVRRAAVADQGHQARRPVMESPPRAALLSSRSGDVFVPARWPYAVIHLRDQFNPLATIFPAMQHYGSCGCWDRCRADSCRNALMHVYCNTNCCPYEGKCSNGLEESPKVFLGRNLRTRQLGVVAAEDIGPGEVLGQYLGEIEHVSVVRAHRPRHGGYRLVLKQRPEKRAYPVCAAINAEGMGGLMRFLNHSCKPAAEFKEVSNRRRTTVVVATTQKIERGAEVTVDYGDDLWFVCRCMQEACRHRSIQDEQDP